MGGKKIQATHHSLMTMTGPKRLNCGNDSLNLKCTSLYMCAHTHTQPTTIAATASPEHRITEPEMMSTMPSVSFPFSIMSEQMLVPRSE